MRKEIYLAFSGLVEHTCGTGHLLKTLCELHRQLACFEEKSSIAYKTAMELISD